MNPSGPTSSDEPRDERPVASLVDAVETLNKAILQAVQSGVSVELVRARRHHDGQGNWGDQFVPSVAAQKPPAAPGP